MRFASRMAAFLILMLMTLTASAETITVSAAISMKDSLERIGNAYQGKTGDHLIFNFDASGKLAQQIRQGAPVDIFISADDEQVDRLIKSGDADAATRRLIVRNTLVLIVPAGARNPPKGFADLAKLPGKLAVGDPRIVPAGRYAMQVLRAFHLTDAVSPRLVKGENVRQVLMYVERGEVDAGIVYGTDAKIAGAAVSVAAVAPGSTHEPIEYPAVIVARSAHAATARRFLEYLNTEPSRTAFAQFGFELPPGPSSRPVK
jgi:molybdate transport system substrate-binding protein